MDPDAWIAALRDMYPRHGRALTAGKERQLQSVVPSSTSNTPDRALSEQIGLPDPTGRIPADAHGTAQELDDVIRREFYVKIPTGATFGPAPLDPMVADAIVKHEHTHKAFCSLLQTFSSFKAEVDDLFPTYHDMILALVLKGILLEFQGCFFPTPGPSRIPYRKRVAAQQYFFATYAATFDKTDWFENNPVLAELRAEEAVWPAFAWGVIAAIVMWFVPFAKWWGTVLFWIAAVLFVLALMDVFRKLWPKAVGKERIDNWDRL